MKIKLSFLLVILMGFFLSGCGSSSDIVPVNPEDLIGTWEAESDMEKVTLVLNQDNTFKFEGTGFASENGEDVLLTETGSYTTEDNKLTLDIQDVQSSGLEYEDFQSEDLGTLEFYMELKEDNQELDLTEKSGSVAYNFKKIG